MNYDKRQKKIHYRNKTSFDYDYLDLHRLFTSYIVYLTSKPITLLHDIFTSRTVYLTFKPITLLQTYHIVT